MSRRAPLPILLLLGALVLSVVICERKVDPVTPCPHSLELCSSLDKMAHQCTLGPAAHIMSDRTAENKKELTKCLKKKERLIQENRKLRREVNILMKLPNQEGCKTQNFKVGTQCFSLSLDKKSWSSAVKTCRQFGGDLAEPNNPQQVIAEIVKRTKGQVFLGVSDLAREGNWVGVSGRPFNTRGLWAPEEPNNNHKGRQEDCITVDTSRNALNDIYCNFKEKYLCEL